MNVRSLSGKRITQGGFTITLIDGDGMAILMNDQQKVAAAPKDEVNRIIEDIRTKTSKGEYRSEGEEGAFREEIGALWQRLAG